MIILRTKNSNFQLSSHASSPDRVKSATFIKKTKVITRLYYKLPDIPIL